MKIKKLVAIVLTIIAMPNVISASDKCIMEVEYKNGSTLALDTEGLVVSAENNKLSCTGPDKNIEIGINDIVALQFITDTSDVSEILSDVPVTVYSDSGIFMGEYVSIDAVRNDVTHPGVYILKSGNNTLKMIVK